MDQKLGPGERLNIDQVARELNCSSVPVREALARLHAEKLVIFVPHHGYRVAPLLDESQYRQMFEVRYLLELKAVELVVMKASTEDIQYLEEIGSTYTHIEGVPTYDKYKPFMTADSQFHRRLFDIAGNVFLTETWEHLHVHMHQARLYRTKGQVEIVDQAILEHKDIVQALKQRSRERAVEAMAQHLMGSFQRIVGSNLLIRS
ncbi:MAG: GntR family transcriptional regulator [Alicyclobacillus macrosporangiidus]|nr:GntR family transcriptional regulator [Alicyclobacillus macrosporangiidus]